MASINQMGGTPAINNLNSQGYVPQGYVPYYIPNYNNPLNNNVGYVQHSPYQNYLNGKGAIVEREVSQNQFFKGRPVSSKEEAQASQIDLDGSLWVFTDIGNQKIYTKQINLDGTVSFNTYVLTVEKEENLYNDFSNFVTKDEFNKAIQAIVSSISGEKRTPTTGENILDFN